MGGLGNQLFIYAAGRAVAEKLRVPLLIDTSHYSENSGPGPSRSWQLSFLVSARMVKTRRPVWFSTSTRFAIERRLPNLPWRKVFRESDFSFDSRVEGVAPGTRMLGYFQSWRYFDGIKESLRRDFFERVPRTPWLVNEQALLRSLGPWIGVHIRLGDYLTPKNKEIYGVLGSTYYQNSLNQISQKSEFPLVLFSDEPSEAIKILQPIHPIAHVIQPPPYTHPAEVLVLMSEAQKMIIANSSYGWWGAWLAASRGSTVIAPSPWFRNESIPCSDLYPDTWLLMDRGEART